MTSAGPRLLFFLFLRLQVRRGQDISLMSLSPPGEEGRSVIPKEQPGPFHLFVTGATY